MPVRPHPNRVAPLVAVVAVLTALTGCASTTTPPVPPSPPSAATPSVTPSTTHSPSGDSTPADLARCLTGDWTFTDEDAGGTTESYRPAATVPVSRGRRGYTFGRGGHVVVWVIAPADGSVPEQGHWTIGPHNVVTVRFGNVAQTVVLHVDACDPERLVVERTS